MLIKWYCWVYVLQIFLSFIVRVVLPPPMVLHMLQFVVLRYIFQFWPVEFYLSDKILINIGKVLWCYSAVCHDLQYQRLWEGPGICSLFFMNFNSFNYIQIKIWNGMLCWFTFLEAELFFYGILCLSMNSISLEYISFSNILLRMHKMKIGQ